MKIGQIFGIPIAVQKFELDIKALSEFCYEIKKIDSGRKVSNAGGGWQSNDLNIDKYFEENEHYKMFVTNVVGSVKGFAKRLGIIPDVHMQNMWINISNSGAYNHVHAHSRSIVSGCFYVKTPENCGSIVFTNPNKHLMRAYLEYWHLMDEGKLDNSPLSHFDWQIDPEENNIVMFPSWLEHHVDDNKSDEDRISISFNFSAMIER